MTPIDNAILSEMLDNSLYDIKLLRQEVASLREAKASALAEAYELREELDSRDEELRQALRSATTAHTEAKGIIEALRKQHRELQDDLAAMVVDRDEYKELYEGAAEHLSWHIRRARGVIDGLQSSVEHRHAGAVKSAKRIAELEEASAKDAALIKSLGDEAKDRYEAEQRLREELDSADERIAELASEVERLVRNSELDLAVLQRQSECISDLNTDLRKATLRAHENANLWGEARQEADDLKGRLATAHAKLYDTEQEVEDLKADADALDWYQGETKRLKDEVADCRESLRQSERDLADAEDQIALYQDKCECV